MQARNVLQSGGWSQVERSHLIVFVCEGAPNMRRKNRRLVALGLLIIAAVIVIAAGRQSSLIQPVVSVLMAPLRPIAQILSELAGDVGGLSAEREEYNELQQRTRELEETHRKLEDAQAQLISELEDELQTAHELQMGLMPGEGPQVEGFDIAGRCVPANHVGGDFFQYFHLSRDRLAITTTDVTGHAMEAAIPVVMFDGILESQIKLGGGIEDCLCFCRTR